MSDLGSLQSVLDDWPSRPPAGEFKDACLERFRRLLEAVHRDPASVGVGDIAGIVRHVLRRFAVISSQGGKILRVPRGPGWPCEKLWADSHVRIVGQDATHYRIEANEDWHSQWLEGSDRHPPLRAVFNETLRRDLWPASPHLPLDPTLKYGLKLPFDSYTSPGQRQAVQAAFLMNPGATLVVNLPTENLIDE